MQLLRLGVWLLRGLKWGKSNWVEEGLSSIHFWVKMLLECY